MTGALQPRIGAILWLVMLKRLLVCDARHLRTTCEGLHIDGGTSAERAVCGWTADSGVCLREIFVVYFWIGEKGGNNWKVMFVI